MHLDIDIDITYVSFILTHAMTLHCVASAVIQKTENITFNFKRGLRIAISDCAFPVAGSLFWNSLPPDVTSVPTLFFFGTASKLLFS